MNNDAGCRRFSLLLLMAQLTLLTSGKKPVFPLLPFPGPGGQAKAPPWVGRRPLCGEGYSYFAPFMKCDATLGYCFQYTKQSCVGPPNWSCVHALNREKGTVTGRKQDTVVKRSGLGNSRCCGGKFQSPIDIPVDQATCDPLMTRPAYSKASKQLRGIFENNGNFAEFKVDTLNYDSPLLLKNVPFACAVHGSALYVLTSVQVHVGRGSRRGSEHTLRGRSFDAELHLVHVRRDFWKPSSFKGGGRRPSSVNLGCASQTPLGITIIAVFLSVKDGERNEELEKVLSTYNLRVIKQSKKICPFDKICKVSKRKAFSPNRSDAPRNVILNQSFCPDPSMMEDETMVALLQKKKAKVKGGSRTGGRHQFTLLVGDRKTKFNTLRNIINAMRKKHQRQRKSAGGLRNWKQRLRNSKQDSRMQFKMRPGLLLPKDSAFYQYFGSLTTPPCSEVVNWIVMKQPLRISLEQLTVLRQMESSRVGSPIGAFGSLRPSQPLNGRVVVTNEPC